MSALKVIGGLIALVAGILVLLPVLQLLGVSILSLPYIWQYMIIEVLIGNTFLYINLILVILIILGGLLGIAGKKVGAVFVLIAVILWIIGGLTLSGLEALLPISFSTAMTGNELIGTTGDWFVTLEAIIALLGGILILAGKSEKA
jgi:hypothetical protein